MEWLKRLNEAIDYVEDNLENTLSYDEAARIACCSTFYFQRIFSYVCGVSLSEYIRRRRMTQAAFALQRKDAKIIDIALKYGYNSPTAFNRAFQSVHGISPSAARKRGIVLNAYPAIRLCVQIAGGERMSYRIVRKPAMRVVGVRAPLAEDMEKNHRIIPAFWAKVFGSDAFATICRLSNQQPRKILGVSIYEGPQKMFYAIAAQTEQPVPRGMFAYEIPAATWVVFENSGSFQEDVQSVFRRFFTEWLPFSGYAYAGLPDIEVYPVCGEFPAAGDSEVWIAIKESEEDEKCGI